MIISKYVDIRIGGRNINHYRELGYDVNNSNDIISVPVSDLGNGSHALIKVKCDFCGCTVDKEYKRLLIERNMSPIKMDCCINCAPEKRKQTHLLLYGVENTMQRRETRDNLKKTIFDLFGVDNISKNDIIKNKKSEIRKNKSKDDLKKQKEKTEKTMLKKYGVKSPLQLEHTRKRLFETRSSQSSQQKKIFDILRNKYGSSIESNYFIDNLSLDVYVEIDNIKIDVEYDSWYWHEKNRDRRRDEYLKSKGFKILRIKSGKKIPSLELLFEKIDELLYGNHRYAEIILDDWNEDGYRKEAIDE